ncbi:hypothetical protein DIPPA_34209 [Diplonema papillatum]|nr:hypothetical protein DIPPA_34209 [Diplonema papillatum]
MQERQEEGRGCVLFVRQRRGSLRVRRSQRVHRETGSHSCCDDRKYTYNAVPCTADMDCQACAEPTPDRNGVPQCVDQVYYKKLEISGSKYGFMCCNSDPDQVTCDSGYCTVAPCSGGKGEDSSGGETVTFMSPAWTNVRGDEWSRAECKSCHGDGCSQCEDGYFKYTQRAECVSCGAIHGCLHCQDQGCAQCLSNLPRTKCDALPGTSSPSYCCETGRRTMCVATSSPPLPTRAPTPSTPAHATPLPVPAATSPAPPAPPACSKTLKEWDECTRAPTCCGPDLRCFEQNEWFAQCRYFCRARRGWSCKDLSGTA